MVNINFKFWLIISFWFLLAMTLPRIALASSLAITEVMYNPSGSDTGREWVEVKNISTTTFSLSDGSWRFNDGSSHMITAVSSTNSLLAPNDYAIIVDDPNKFRIDYPNFNGLVFDSSFSLKNSDNKISLFTNGLEDCYVNYQTVWGANDDGRTLELNNEKWQTSFLIGGTPGADSSIWPDNLPPKLQINLPVQAEVGKEVKMTATVSDPENKILTVDWQFGDGQFGSGVEVGHVYSSEGSYTVVTKTIDDTYEVYATSTITITETAVASSGNTLTTWPKIELSELMPNPSGSEAEGEWIELYNNSSSSASLDRWQIGDSSSRRYTFKVENTDTNIEAYSFLLVKRSLSGVSLSNEGEKIVLFAPDGSIKDQITYDKAFEDRSFARQDRAWQWTTKSTPGKLNDIVMPEDSFEKDEDYKVINNKVETKLISTSTQPILDKNVLEQLKLSEIFPNPRGKDDNEWLELKNMSSSSIDLFGYYIDDEDGGSKPYRFSTSTPVAPGEYLILDKNCTKLSLGNIKDSVRLLDQDKRSIWEVSYDNVAEDYSYSFDLENDDWQWTKNVTIGKDNKFSSEDDYSELKVSSTEVENFKINDSQIKQTISQVLDLPDKTEVLTQGVIIVQPDLYAKNIFYLSEYDDEKNEINLSNNIQIYFVNNKKISYKIGDVVEVIGVVTTSKDERRIKINNNEQPVVINNVSKINISEVPIPDVNEMTNGSLIKISGQLLDKKGNSLIVGLGDDTVKVYLKKASSLVAKNFTKGDWLVVSGIVDNQVGKEIRLLPRQLTDIEKVTVAGVSETKTNEDKATTTEKISLNKFSHFFEKKTIFFSLGSIILFIILWESYEFYRKKIK